MLTWFRSKLTLSNKSLLVLAENLRPTFVSESFIKIDWKYDFNEICNLLEATVAEEKCIPKFLYGSALNIDEPESGKNLRGSIRTEKLSNESPDWTSDKLAERITEYWGKDSESNGMLRIALLPLALLIRIFSVH